MSTSVPRRKTLYQVNHKIPQYKKKSNIIESQLMKRAIDYQNKDIMSRKRFQSTNLQNQKENQQALHPIKKYINTKQTVHDQQLRKFSSFLYKGVKYSVNLKQPSLTYIQKRKLSIYDVSFPGEVFNFDKKLLILDLDQTLIHSVGHLEQSDVTLKVCKNILKFNIRPYCYNFLQEMSKHYNIVVYTASTQNYAHPIVQYLNKTKRTIKAVLSRNHCLQTHNGFHIKDLRIIKQFSLKNMIIIDNLVHSFAFQLDNGIPILEFLANKKDRQLYHICDKLIHLSKCPDVSVQIKKLYNLTQVLLHKQNQFIWNNQQRF